MAENPGDFGADIDQRLSIRIPVKAGPHAISATTVLRSHAQKDDLVKPFLRTTIDGLDITGDPSVDRLLIDGPYEARRGRATLLRGREFSCATRRIRPRNCRAHAGSLRRWRGVPIAARCRSAIWNRC